MEELQFHFHKAQRQIIAVTMEDHGATRLVPEIYSCKQPDVIARCGARDQLLGVEVTSLRRDSGDAGHLFDAPRVENRPQISGDGSSVQLRDLAVIFCLTALKLENCPSILVTGFALRIVALQ